MWRIITDGRGEAQQDWPDILDVLHHSVTRAVAILGMRCTTLSDVISGRVSLSPDMALRIEKAFDASMDTFATC